MGGWVAIWLSESVLCLDSVLVTPDTFGWRSTPQGNIPQTPASSHREVQVYITWHITAIWNLCLFFFSCQSGVCRWWWHVYWIGSWIANENLKGHHWQPTSHTIYSFTTAGPSDWHHSSWLVSCHACYCRRLVIRRASLSHVICSRNPHHKWIITWITHCMHQ